MAPKNFRYVSDKITVRLRIQSFELLKDSQSHKLGQMRISCSVSWILRQLEAKGLRTFFSPVPHSSSILRELNLGHACQGIQGNSHWAAEPSKLWPLWGKPPSLLQGWRAWFIVTAFSKHQAHMYYLDAIIPALLGWNRLLKCWFSDDTKPSHTCPTPSLSYHCPFSFRLSLPAQPPGPEDHHPAVGSSPAQLCAI